jgi:hypothetical protein
MGGFTVPHGASEFYRLYAGRCVEIARRVTDSDSKATLLSMAQLWLGLADQADKNTQAPMIIYETPEPRQPVTQQQQQPQPKKDGK